MTFACAHSTKPKDREGANALVQRKAECCAEENVDTAGLPRFLGGVQAKLTVGATDDPLEREADEFSRAVMQGETSAPRFLGLERPHPPAQVQRLHSECAEDLADDAEASVARGLIRRAISSPAGGAPLTGAVRARVEPALGGDLGHVRVHSGPQANETAAALQAKAFTHRNHIWIGPGQSAEDVGLMAHESTHVAQQGHAGAVPGRLSLMSDSSAATIQRVPEDMTLEFPTHTDVTASDGSRTREDRLDEIRKILANWWVGPLDEARLEAIWNSFGAQVFEVAAANLDLWNQCLERGAELHDIDAVEAAKEAFRSDTRQNARNYLDLNEHYILAEMGAVGLYENVCMAPTEEQDERLAEMQDIANEVIFAQQAQDDLRRVPVGWNEISFSDGGSMYVEGYFDPERQPQFDENGVESNPVYYGEDMRPRVIPEDMRSGQPLPSWSSVKEHYDNMTQVISGFANRYPVIYSVLQQNSAEAMATLAAGGPQEARSVISKAFGETLGNIRATRPKIGNDLDDRDLQPIHAQLFSGAVHGPSGIDWSNDLYKGVAEEMLADHERVEFWISLGLGTLAAGAFVVVELASAGSATFFIAAGVGLGATGVQVGRSWEQYEDLATAADTEVSEEMQLVTQGQASAALVTALVDSAFAFIDAAAPALLLAKGTGAAGRVVTHAGGEALVEAAGREGAEALPAAGSHATAEAGEAATETAVRAGARETGEAGAETASSAAVRLRPENAANWSEVQSFIGTRVDPNNVPSGYRSFTRGGKSFIRRISGDDARFARLTVDENGLIQAGRSVTRRISRPGALAANLGSRPARHQAHHVVPDQVVRDHPLFDMARRRGRPPYDLDNASNGAYLAETPADRVAGISDELPTHSGSHPTYNALATREADGVMGRLIQRYGSLDNVPPDVLTSAAHDVERRMREQLRTWASVHGDALK